MGNGGRFLIEHGTAESVFSREKFDEIHREMQTAVADFGQNSIAPANDDIEKLDYDLLKSLMAQAGELGLCAIDIPEKYDGMELDKITSVIVGEELTHSGHSASFMTTFMAHSGIGTLPIVYFGTEEQKQKYLPGLGSGTKISAYCLTESGSGSDALAAKTTAMLTEDGKHYIVNGTKTFISNGAIAEVFIIYAQVDGDKFSTLILEKGMDGLEVGAEEKKLGLKGSSTTEIIMNDVKVPVENLLGKIGKGHIVAFNILNVGRFKLGSADLGGCKFAIDATAKYVLERRQFGQKIGNFGAIKKKIADMAVQTFALDSMLYRTVGLMEAGISGLDDSDENYHRNIASAIEEFAIEASIAKVYGSEAMFVISDQALQSYGGYGFTEEYPMARATRDTRVDRIFEGTNEINRQIIAGFTLKKALTEEIPIRDTINKMKMKRKLPTFEGELAQEKTVNEFVRMLILDLLNESIIRFGQDLKNQQQLAENLADMIIETYALDSTIARIENALAGGGNAENLLAIAKLQMIESLDHAMDLYRKSIPTVVQDAYLSKHVKFLEDLYHQVRPWIDVFELKEHIADEIYKQEKYIF